MWWYYPAIGGRGWGLKRKNRKRECCFGCIGIRVICAFTASLGSIFGMEGEVAVPDF